MKTMYIFLDTKSIAAALKNEIQVKNTDSLKESARRARDIIIMSSYEKDHFESLEDYEYDIIDKHNKEFYKKSEDIHVDSEYVYLKDGKVFYSTVYNDINFDYAETEYPHDDDIEDSDEDDSIDINDLVSPVIIDYDDIIDNTVTDQEDAISMLMSTMLNINVGMGMAITTVSIAAILKKALIALVLTVGCEFIHKLDKELSEYKDEIDGYEYIHNMSNESDKKKVVECIKAMFKKPIDKFVNFIKNKFSSFVNSESMGMAIPKNEKDADEIIPVNPEGGTLIEESRDKSSNTLNLDIVDTKKRYKVDIAKNVVNKKIDLLTIKGSPSDNIDKFIMEILESIDNIKITVNFENNKTYIFGIDRNICIDKDIFSDFVVMIFKYNNEEKVIKYDKLFLEEFIRFGKNGLTKSNKKKIRRTIDDNIVKTERIVRVPSNLNNKFYEKFVKLNSIWDMSNTVYDGHYRMNNIDYYLFHNSNHKITMYGNINDDQWCVDKK